MSDLETYLHSTNFVLTIGSIVGVFFVTSVTLVIFLIKKRNDFNRACASLTDGLRKEFHDFCCGVGKDIYAFFEGNAKSKKAASKVGYEKRGFDDLFKEGNIAPMVKPEFFYGELCGIDLDSDDLHNLIQEVIEAETKVYEILNSRQLNAVDLVTLSGEVVQAKARLKQTLLKSKALDGCAGDDGEITLFFTIKATSFRGKTFFWIRGRSFYLLFFYPPSPTRLKMEVFSGKSME